MSCVWVICGAGRGVGKTTLARKLCELLPNSVYAKCGHGAPKAGKPENFFATIAELDAFAHKSARTAEHVVIESNSYARTVQGGIVVFIDSMPNQTRQRKDAGSLREAAQVIVSAGSSRTSYNDALEDALPDEQLRGAACELFARQQNYLAGNHPAVRTKVWLETAGERVFGNGLAKLLESVELRGTLGGAAREAGLSYRYAWNLIRSAEKRTGRELVIRQPGGPKGGSSTLSEFGRQMLSLFQTLDHDVATYTDRRLAELYKENCNAGHE